MSNGPGFLKRYERSFRPFTATEAWNLFRLAAIGEAIGWSLLITGIALKRYAFHGNDAAVLIAGQVHGTLFIIYITACVLLYPSLSWSFWQAFIAGLASIPPYGSLVIEQYAARHRRLRSFRTHYSLLVLRAAAKLQ